MANQGEADCSATRRKCNPSLEQRQDDEFGFRLRPALKYPFASDVLGPIECVQSAGDPAKTSTASILTPGNPYDRKNWYAPYNLMEKASVE
jgi:hypothetical protein